MIKIFEYIKKTILPPYKSTDIPLIAITLFVILTMVLTVGFLRRESHNKLTFAQAVNNFVEPESGVLSGNALIVNNNDASGGKYVQLGLIATGQCSGAQPPPAAQATGITKLAFCDDFSDINRSFDLTDAKWNPNVLWSRQIPWMSKHASANGFSVTDGILRLASDYDSYQWTFTSAHKDASGNLRGFWLQAEREWYAEIRWRFESDFTTTSGFPAFWSMDTCHVYGIPACTSRTWLGAANPEGKFIEPDFVEKWGAGNAAYLTALHHHSSVNNVMTANLSMCQKQQAYPTDPTQFHTSSIHVNPNQADGVVRYYYNDNQLMWEINKTLGSCAKGNAEFLAELDAGWFPINVGAGPSGSPIYIDYIRVWVKP